MPRGETKWIDKTPFSLNRDQSNVFEWPDVYNDLFAQIASSFAYNSKNNFLFIGVEQKNE